MADDGRRHPGPVPSPRPAPCPTQTESSASDSPPVPPVPSTLVPVRPRSTHQRLGRGAIEPIGDGTEQLVAGLERPSALGTGSARVGELPRTLLAARPLVR
eukprot:scaffold221_cov122-Isochrysis_galbana.AAC.3